MADIRDERGNPIQLTDQHGNPVQLTDEYGNPVHLSGVATTGVDSQVHGGATTGTYTLNAGTTVTNASSGGSYLAGDTGIGAQSDLSSEHGGGTYHQTGVGADKSSLKGVTVTEVTAWSTHPVTDTGLRRSGSSSSSSSEDDGQGGRRKKKGLKEKIKEKLTGGKHKDGHSSNTAHSTTAGSNYNTTTDAGQRYHPQEHEKKSMMEKIKEKLPGHHAQPN